MKTALRVIALVLAVTPAAYAQQAVAVPNDRARVAIFAEPNFPAIDAPRPDVDAIRTALAAFDVAVFDSSALQAALDGGQISVLVMPFGSAFPQDAWPSIDRFLSRGGNLVNVGGVPFAAPVIRERAGWRPARRTTSYHKQLGIVQAFPIDASAVTYRAVAQDDQSVRALAADARARRIFELIVRLTTTKTFPDEDGSDGPREARLTALVHAFGATTPLPVAAPFVQIDRLEGRFAGGRWLLATGDGGAPARAVAALVIRAAAGAAELTVQPRYAGFHPGEPIDLTVSLRRPLRAGLAAEDPVRADVQALDSSGRIIASTSTTLVGSGPVASAQLTLPVDSAAMARGLYRVRAEVSGEPEGQACQAEAPAFARRGPAAGDELRRGSLRGRARRLVGQVGQVGHVGQATSGFWIYDAAMLRGGRPLTAGRDYFERDGLPFPVAGTTYMASDVHRRFLLEPNPALWAHDFAAMAQSGVNMVRTGIWTGWSLHSETDGRPTEAMLRSLEIFLLTARQHDIPVIFTFFAFVPPAWGGGNAYFDTRAVDAQKRFAGAIAGRLAGADDIIWDLINEPSFSSANRLWLCRPNYDAAEQAAWQAWLRDTLPAEDEAARAALLHERWNSVAGDALRLPALQDFRDMNLFGLAHPNKAADYRRFAQEAFTRWVRDVGSAIRANGNRAQLITVGQDEGGAGERPNPLLFGEAVDFTGTHTWWNNDALLWDALLAKRIDRPALVEETGLMTYERPDGSAWRSEEDARNLLERKLALAIASAGAGFVQWLWNSNVYMPLDNEAGIGFLRADGTAKPEIDAFVRAASFLRARRDRLIGRSLENVVVVIPQSEVFSVRDQGTAATQRAVRTLEYDLRVPARALSEYATADLRRGARLLVLPSPRMLTESAWTALLAAVDAGSTLLVTGPIDRDEYERPVTRLSALGIRAITRPVAPDNGLRVGTLALRVPFRGSKLERVERAVVEGAAPARVDVIRHGKGTIVWCPLPVELSDDDRATGEVYRFALRIAGVRPTVSVAATTQRVGATRRVTPTTAAGILIRPLRFADCVLLVVVNETDSDADLQLRVDGVPQPVRVHVAAERATMVVVDKKTQTAVPAHVRR